MAADRCSSLFLCQLFYPRASTKAIIINNNEVDDSDHNYKDYDNNIDYSNDDDNDDGDGSDDRDDDIVDVDGDDK